jgi:hypothetical protein
VLRKSRRAHCSDHQPTCDRTFSFTLLDLCHRAHSLSGHSIYASYSTYPPSSKVSYLIQIKKSTRLKVIGAGRFTPAPQPRSARACSVRVCVKETPACGHGLGHFMLRERLSETLEHLGRNRVESYGSTR